MAEMQRIQREKEIQEQEEAEKLEFELEQ